MEKALLADLKRVEQELDVLKINDKSAKEFERLIREAISILLQLQAISDKYSSPEVIEDLEYILKKHVRDYRETVSKTKKDKHTDLKNAKSDTLGLLSQILAKES